MPVITIGMPIYNGEQHLRATLDSLLKQTFSDFEILISDNCSTDGTVAIVEEFSARDDRIRLIRQDRNAGALANFIFVLNQASSEFFLWRAYDDVCDPNYLEVLLHALQDSPHCALSAPTVVRNRLDGSESARINFPDIAALSPVDRARCLIRNVSAGWMYGLFRRTDLVQAFSDIAAAYPHPWAQDHIIVLHFILQGRLTGSNATTFYQLETGKSAQAYRPQSLRGQWRMAWDFLRNAFQELFSSNLTTVDQLALTPTLFHYTDGKTERYHRLIRRSLAWPFNRLIAIITRHN